MSSCAYFGFLRLSVAIACLLLTGSVGQANAADELERQLLKQAPEVLQYARDAGYKNIGVLKFRVKKGNHAGTDRGVLNSNLAERLEMALILVNKAQDPIGVIHNASAVAAKIPGANHLTGEGRKQLFTARYPLAWGHDEVTPDALFTGVAAISHDLRSMTVAILVVKPTGEELAKVCQFQVTPDVDVLVASGESFVTRGLFDMGKVQQSDAANAKAPDATAAKSDSTAAKADAATVAIAASATKVKDSTDAKDHPLAPSNAEAPVELEIFYDKQKIDFEIRDGQAFIVEPQATQQVSLVLKRKANDALRYGVVLKVNGENTLEHQRLKDAACRKWILELNSAPLVIKGFQTNQESAEAFKVLAPAESKAKEIDYGTDVGTISLVVFKESTDAATTPAVSDDEDFAALKRGVFPKQQAANLSALKAQLTDKSSGRGLSRGLIVQGEQIDSATKRVTFNTDPTPVMSAVITYYPRQQ